MSDKNTPAPAPSSPAIRPPQENPLPYIESGHPLPDNYGQTMVVLMPRDPRWMFAYWEITESTTLEIKRQHGEDIFYWTQPTLRMYEVPAANPTAASLRHIDVSVALDTGNWYLNADREGSSWYVELGLKTPDGRFILLAKSNVITLPMASVSTVLDERWASLKDELEKVFAASGGGRLGGGSLELARRLSQRWVMLSQISSWKSSGSSSFGAARMPASKKGRMFWLVADCELVLYGATEPDAAVTVAGKPIELYPDGTFSLRFALPDSKLELPIKAVSGDHAEERVIKITVERRTSA